MDITVRELAKRLNVSATTISLVLNNKPGISEETKKRVLDEVAATGYDISKVASKKEKAIGTIGFIIHKWEAGIGRESTYVQDYIKGVDACVKKKGYELNVQFAVDVTALPADRYSGIIVLATGMNDPSLRSFLSYQSPTVLIDKRFETSDVDCVTMDNAQGIYLAVAHMAELGHKKIAYIHSRMLVNNISDRLSAFSASMQMFSLSFDPRDVVDMSGDNREWADIIKQYLSETEQKPTAILIDNGAITLGAYQACKDLGIKIGKDISVIGFDDFDFCSIIEPPTTTIRVHAMEMGRQAAERLLDRISNPAGVRIHINVGTELIVRDSTCKNEKI